MNPLEMSQIEVERLLESEFPVRRIWFHRSKMNSVQLTVFFPTGEYRIATQMTVPKLTMDLLRNLVKNTVAELH